MRFRHTLLGLFSVALLGTAGFFYFAEQPELPVSEVPDNASFDASLIA
jgi:hypothetical protein